MQGHGSDKTSSSLLTMWGANKQADWALLKERAISDAVLLMQQKSPLDFEELHQSIIAARVAISSLLSPEVTEDIRRTRTDVRIFSYTNIGSTGTYKDYHQVLLAGFDMLAGKYPVQIYTPINPEFYGFADSMELHESREIIIEYQETEYSTIIKHKLTDSESMLGEEEWITIMHTPVVNIPVIMDRVKILYNSLTAVNTPAEKMAIIKEMAWHLAHAMTQFRGSAAISEILVEALLRHHGIASTAPNRSIPIDLVALFSATPEEFAKRIQFNHELESESLVKVRSLR